MERIEKLIFDQAERTPAAIAVEGNGARLSYLELRRQSMQVSRSLERLGLRPGRTVGIFQNRSPATIPLILGVWNAGGVIVPINSQAPVRMLERLIKNSSPQLIVTENSLKQRVVSAVNQIGADSVPILLTEELAAEGDAGEQAFTPSGAIPEGREGSLDSNGHEDIAYIIYTSGSEGLPKGIIGVHSGLIQYLRWQAEEFVVRETDRFSQIAPLSFDFSLKEIFVPLICGARVCMADRTIVIDPEKFLKWVGESKITVMCCVPTLVRSLLQTPVHSADDTAFQSLRHILISGDMLRWDDVSSWRKRFGAAVPLCNLYGPTESTVIKLFYPIPETRCMESMNVPVGRPISDADVLILDEHDQPCRPGQTGEIVILSEWIARGYINNDPSNAHSFRRFFHNGKLVRAYRTGDIGRFLKDGNVELIGRKDRQVKIRGYRIELNEIESALSEHPEVNDVAVVVPQRSGDAGEDGSQVIACYYTSDKDAITESEIREHARQRLLPHVLSLMQFIRLSEMPLSANSKVDRHALGSMGVRNTTGIVEQSRCGEALTVQQRILAIWRELLSLGSVDPESNFFEIGGDSMMAIRLLRKLREEFQSEIALADVYKYPSISQLSERLNQLIGDA